MAETQRAMAARTDKPDGPPQSRTPGQWQNARVDGFNGVHESWVEYRMHFEATVRVNPAGTGHTMYVHCTNCTYIARWEQVE